MWDRQNIGYVATLWRLISLLFFFVAVVVVLLGRHADADEIPLKNDHGTYTIPVRINDTLTLDFTLDTGASIVTVPRDVARTLLRTGTVARSDFTGTGVASLADGSQVPTPHFTIRQLRVGQYVISNVDASVVPEGGSLLLGQSFLSRLPSWTIDYRRAVLVIGQPVAAAPIPAPAPPSAPGSGYGAVAVGTNSRHYGFSRNTDQRNADYLALTQCGAADCQIVFRIGPGECGAVASAWGTSAPMGSRTLVSTAWGAAKHSQRALAERAALANCQKHTALQCTISAAECN